MTIGATDTVAQEREARHIHALREAARLSKIMNSVVIFSGGTPTVLAARAAIVVRSLGFNPRARNGEMFEERNVRAPDRCELTIVDGSAPNAATVAAFWRRGIRPKFQNDLSVPASRVVWLTEDMSDDAIRSAVTSAVADLLDAPNTPQPDHAA